MNFRREIEGALRGALLASAAILPLATPAAGPVNAASSAKARLLYIQHCVGCHVMDGSGAPEKGIPSFRGQLDDFLRIPGGREYIVQVPGVMTSPLNDQEIALLMNWLVPNMSTGTATTSFATPYTAAEIGELRHSRPADITATRDKLITQMRQRDSN